MTRSIPHLCPRSDECGSCGWSHIPYEKQLAQKLADINGSLRLKELSESCEEILPSPVTEHYRNRMDFVIDFKGQVGLREKGKWWRVIDNHHCFLSDQRIESLFSKGRAWVPNSGLSYFDRKAYHGILRYLVIRATRHGEAMVSVNTSLPTESEPPELIEKALEELSRNVNATTVVWSKSHTTADVSVGNETQTISGPGFIREEVRGFTYRITPHAFFQTNSHASPLLMDAVLEFCGDISGIKVLDLYCGSGFFSLPLAKRGAQVKGVELVDEAIRDAKLNAEDNGLTIDFEAAKAEESKWEHWGAETVVVDPPRSGMHDRALQALLRADPKRIVYISCNYKSFARELVILKEKYCVENMRAIDMFPHTPHVELVVSLTRKR